MTTHEEHLRQRYPEFAELVPGPEFVAIAIAFQAKDRELDRLRAALAQPSRDETHIWTNTNWKERAEAAEAATARVRKLHEEHEGRCVRCVQWCDCMDQARANDPELKDLEDLGLRWTECPHGNEPHPCPTIRALDGQEPDHG